MTKLLPVTVERPCRRGNEMKMHAGGAKNGCDQRAHGANSMPAQSKRPCRRGNGMKYARRHGEERQSGQRA
ncbi:MAG: hypothetical protein ACLR23_06210 [Clostridia bacterium]